MSRNSESIQEKTISESDQREETRHNKKTHENDTVSHTQSVPPSFSFLTLDFPSTSTNSSFVIPPFMKTQQNGMSSLLPNPLPSALNNLPNPVLNSSRISLSANVSPINAFSPPKTRSYLPFSEGGNELKKNPMVITDPIDLDRNKNMHSRRYTPTESTFIENKPQQNETQQSSNQQSSNQQSSNQQSSNQQSSNQQNSNQQNSNQQNSAQNNTQQNDAQPIIIDNKIQSDETNIQPIRKTHSVETNLPIEIKPESIQNLQKVENEQSIENTKQKEEPKNLTRKLDLNQRIYTRADVLQCVQYALEHTCEHRRQIAKQIQYEKMVQQLVENILEHARVCAANINETAKTEAKNAVDALLNDIQKRIDNVKNKTFARKKISDIISTSFRTSLKELTDFCVSMSQPNDAKYSASAKSAKDMTTSTLSSLNKLEESIKAFQETLVNEIKTIQSIQKSHREKELEKKDGEQSIQTKKSPAALKGTFLTILQKASILQLILFCKQNEASILQYFNLSLPELLSLIHQLSKSLNSNQFLLPWFDKAISLCDFVEYSSTVEIALCLFDLCQIVLSSFNPTEFAHSHFSATERLVKLKQKMRQLTFASRQQSFIKKPLQQTSPTFQTSQRHLLGFQTTPARNSRPLSSFHSSPIHNLQPNMEHYQTQYTPSFRTRFPDRLDSSQTSFSPPSSFFPTDPCFSYPRRDYL